mgnify:CR=1 FL=1
MAKCQKRYLVLLGLGLLVIIAAGVWMVFGRKTQIYEDITWAELEPGTENMTGRKSDCTFLSAI